jgi:ornithine cyclodeaminase/alanine dehydrogenase-like protein (mu-crystallin family)
MPAYFDEQHARRTLDMAAVLDPLRNMFLAQARGTVRNVPRTRTPVFDRSLNITAAIDETSGRYAVKIYGAGGFHILLYARGKGLLAIMESDWLGQLRTGAATGIASALMARSDAGRVAIIGAGRQARCQLLALKAVGKLNHAVAFARNREALKRFCAEMTRTLECEVAPAPSAESAVREADVVVTATNSAKPVLEREWLAPGTHVNGMGANSAQRMELALEVVRDASLIAVDDREQARKEAAEFIALDKADAFDWERVTPLCRLVESGVPNRDPRAITVFKSLGAGLEDLAIASLLYDRSTGGDH